LKVLAAITQRRENTMGNFQRALTQDDVGRRVWFRVVTRWGICRGPRVIRTVDEDLQRVTVRLGGWSHFGIRHNEIEDVA
jgi:hypothetical protein